VKRGTPNHPKLQQLAEALGINEAWAVGLLELLFHVTARYAPQGNIGKWSDTAIAAHLRWPKKERPEILIEALISTGWLDRDPDHRLLVHEWEEHADQSVRKTLKLAAKDFIKPVFTSQVYFIRATATNQIKIGVTSDPKQRFADLQRATTERLEWIGSVEGGFKLEDELHKKFGKSRVRGEWFEMTDELLLQIKELTGRTTGNSPTSDPIQDGLTARAMPFLSFPEPQPVPRNGVSRQKPSYTPSRFDEWIKPWKRCASPDDAARAWLSTVESPEDEKKAFEARDRYLRSAEVARGAIMDPVRFLMQQKQNHWKGIWPTVERAETSKEIHYPELRGGK